MKTKDLKSLLNRAAAALETPDDLNYNEKHDIIEDLCVAAKSIAPRTALVIREGETGDGGVIRVIVVPDKEIPDNLDELVSYGSQCVDRINFDECDYANEVQAILDDMNPPSEDEDEDED